MLSEKQVNQIFDILVEQGVSYEALQIDLLDHICCMVEEKMDNGKDFGQSLTLSIQEFGLGNLSEVQETTIHLLTIKLRKMKKVVGILGIVSAILVIAGVLFKVNHFPGAGMMLVIGLISACAMVIPFMAYFEMIKKKNILQVIGIASGYVSAILLTLATLFKIMHWPGFFQLYFPGLILLVFVFLPINTWKNYKMAENKIMAFAKSLLVLAAVVVFWGVFHGINKHSHKTIQQQHAEQLH